MPIVMVMIKMLDWKKGDDDNENAGDFNNDNDNDDADHINDAKNI
jgi:hypothetical protein